MKQFLTYRSAKHVTANGITIYNAPYNVNTKSMWYIIMNGKIQNKKYIEWRINHCVIIFASFDARNKTLKTWSPFISGLNHLPHSIAFIVPLKCTKHWQQSSALWIYRGNFAQCSGYWKLYSQCEHFACKLRNPTLLHGPGIGLFFRNDT